MRSTRSRSRDTISVSSACISALGLLAGCAASEEARRPVTVRPALASVAPVENAEPPLAAEEIRIDLSAAALLERGFGYFREDEPALAGDAFRAALATGNLNDAGRTLAYWHIYLAERSQGRVELGAEALSSFLTVGQDILESRTEEPLALEGGVDFVERFDLERRMTRARATLSAIWAGRVPSFGRSMDKPVPVRSDTEVHYFLELAPPCADAPDRQVSRRDQIHSQEGELERVTVRCHGRQRSAEYFFENTEDDGEPD